MCNKYGNNFTIPDTPLKTVPAHLVAKCLACLYTTMGLGKGGEGRGRGWPHITVSASVWWPHRVSVSVRWSYRRVSASVRRPDRVSLSVMWSDKSVIVSYVVRQKCQLCGQTGEFQCRFCGRTGECQCQICGQIGECKCQLCGHGK